MSSKKDYKIWTAVSGGPGMMVTPEDAFLIGNKNNFIVANKGGVSIIGNSITLGTVSENIRRGGLFVNMNDFIRMIPSTIVTPIPANIPYPPLGMAATILKDLPFFIAMMGVTLAAGSV